jgi:hypothetical protein
MTEPGEQGSRQKRVDVVVLCDQNGKPFAAGSWRSLGRLSDPLNHTT